MASLKTISLLLALVPALLAQHDRFGLPACSGPGLELADRSYFVLCHSSDRKVPLWVGYELTPEHVTRIASRHNRFRRDAQLHSLGAADADYRHSGFSRGHMAPAADFAWSDDAMRATFLLSNAVPQNQRVNAGVWAQLERVVRRVAHDADAVYVFTGPLFDSVPETIGLGAVAVPSHTFKVVLVIQRDRKWMFAAIVPNADLASAPLGTFTTTVDEVERRTGLDFFAELPDEQEEQLEAASRSEPQLAAVRLNQSRN
jgi:endonuclease G